MPRQQHTTASKWAKVTLFGSTVLFVVAFMTLVAIKAHEHHKFQQQHGGFEEGHHGGHHHGGHHHGPEADPAHPHPHHCHAHHHFVSIAMLVGLTGIAASYFENKRLVRLFIVGVFVLELVVLAGASVATHRRIQTCRAEATKEVVAVKVYDVTNGVDTARVVEAQNVGVALDLQQEDRCVKHVKTAMLFGGMSLILILWSMMCCGLGLHRSIAREEVQQQQQTGYAQVAVSEEMEGDAPSCVKAASDATMQTTIVVATVMPQ